MQYEQIFEQLRTNLQLREIEHVRELLQKLEAPDVADFIEGLEEEEQDILFDLLEPEFASDVVAEMEPKSLDDFVDGMSPAELARIVTNMAPDDAADFVEELDLSDEEERQILSLLPEDERREISELMGYEEYSGGSIMTPELCSLASNMPVVEAVKAIGVAKLSDPIMFIFVVEPKTGVLLGYVYLTELIRELEKANSGVVVTLEELVHKNYAWANTDDDQEKIARDFRKYNLLVMPVVDEKHRLVGRITADDIMDVIQEEADDDMARMIGVSDFEDLEDSPYQSAKIRLPWLLITMIAGLINSFLVLKIQSTLAAAACFVPVLMGMGGNTSVQSTAITIREIALGRNSKRMTKTLIDQLLTGAMMGTVAAILVWIGTFTIQSIMPVTDPVMGSKLALSTAVALAMFVGMMFASCFGSLVPIILNRLRIDPAIASGPFVSTSNDLLASIIFLLICMLIL